MSRLAAQPDRVMRAQADLIISQVTDARAKVDEMCTAAKSVEPGA